MRRYPAALTLILLLGGCHAPMPSFNMLAPYGTTRVPPPATGSFGSPDTYYQPSLPPTVNTTPSSAVGSGLRAQNNTGNWSAANATSPSTRSRRTGTPTPADPSTVRLAEFQEPAGLVPAESVIEDSRRIRVVDGSVRSSSHDLAEPRAFAPPSKAIDIMDLPPVVQSRAITTRSRLTDSPVTERIVRGNSSDPWRPRTR